MRRQILNLAVLVIVLTLSLSFVAVLPVTSQDKERIKSELETLHSMVGGEHPCLANKVNAVINQIEAGAFHGALNKLVNDVNKTITTWVENPTELYKQLNKIVDLIKGITPPPPPQSPYFEISAYPQELEIEQNKESTSTIKVKSFHGFNQRIDLSAELTPATDKVTLWLDPTWVIPTPSGNTSTLTVAVAADAEARDYLITVTGTNGTHPRSKDITLKVTPLKDFSIDATPASLIIRQGGSNLSVITVTSLEGFSQLVDLDITSPTVPGVDVVLDPWQVHPPPYMTAVSLLTVDVASNVALGAYTITVEGTSGLLTNSVSIPVEIKAPLLPYEPPGPPVPDFTVVAAPSSLTVQQGDSNMSTIIVASLNGFSKPVVLTITSEPILGVNIAIEPSEVTPPANGFATSTLTVSVDADTSPSEHTITIVGTGDTLERSVSVSLKIVVEKNPPVIVSVLRQPEKPSYNETVTVLASVTDAVSGVKDVILSHSGGAAWKNETMTLQDELYRAAIPTFPFNTSVRYCIYASDNVGNWAEPSIVYSYVVTDPYPPVIGYPSWSPENPAANEEITLNVTVTEPQNSSGVKRVTLWYANTTMSVWLSVPMTFKDPNWTTIITNQSDTTVTFFIEAFDKAGNKAETEELEFTVAAPPQVPLAWILAAIAVIGAGGGGGIYYWRQRRKKPSGTLASSTPAPTAPKPTEASPTPSPTKRPPRHRVSNGASVHRTP